MFNQTQKNFLASRGYSEANFKEAPPEIRLEVANLADHEAAAASTLSKSGAEYLAIVGKPIDELTAAERDHLLFWNDLGARSEAARAEESEVPKPVASDGPIEWRVARLDTDRLNKELGPEERIDVLHSFRRVQRAGAANSREQDVLQAKAYLARA